MTLTKEQSKLTERDKDLIKTFKTLCKIDNHQTFTSDTFRMYGLDRFFKDKAHGIGGFFARLLKNGMIRQVGWSRSKMPSNNYRAIRVYEWATN